MIAISSYKPFDKSKEIARNQLRAKASWDMVFDGIIYFGEPEPELKSPKTEFIPCEEFPHIWLLVMAASQAKDHACLINADIVVSPALKHLWPIERMAACTSRRFEFVGDNIHEARIADWGIDFFMANPWVWSACWRAIPKHLRIGHCAWDSWMLSFLNKHCGRRFCDITSFQCIFHPKHEERSRPHSIHNPPPYSDMVGLPRDAACYV